MRITHTQHNTPLNTHIYQLFQVCDFDNGQLRGSELSTLQLPPTVVLDSCCTAAHHIDTVKRSDSTAVAVADESLLEEEWTAAGVVWPDVPLLSAASGVRCVDCCECLPCLPLAAD